MIYNPNFMMTNWRYYSNSKMIQN